MSGTKAGRQKTKDTLIKRLGSEAAYMEYMASISSKGGRTLPTKPRGFATLSQERHHEVSSLGGRNSRSKAQDEASKK